MSTISCVAFAALRLWKPRMRMFSELYTESPEKLPSASTPVLPSSSMKNCASPELPSSGLVGWRSGGSAASDSGAVSSMTFISSAPSFVVVVAGGIGAWRNLFAGFTRSSRFATEGEDEDES